MIMLSGTIVEQSEIKERAILLSTDKVGAAAPLP